MSLSVLIPACNEARFIGPCLDALLASDPAPEGAVEVIVIANGCRDDTAARALSYAAQTAARGWSLQVLDLPEGGKMAALNAGDAAAGAGTRVYLDADVRVSPPLLAELASALAPARPLYATGTPEIAPAESRITRAYGRFWQRLPFLQQGAPGFGVFAVNAAGRSRWGVFPDIISDDTFVRLHFAPAERVQVPARYRWPLVEGLGALVRVRRRQDRGVREIAARYPELLGNDTKPRPALGPLLRADPLGFAVYGSVAALVRLTGWRDTGWVRGR